MLFQLHEVTARYAIGSDGLIAECNSVNPQNEKGHRQGGPSPLPRQLQREDALCGKCNWPLRLGALHGGLRAAGRSAINLRQLPQFARLTGCSQDWRCKKVTVGRMIRPEKQNASACEAEAFKGPATVDRAAPEREG